MPIYQVTPLAPAYVLLLGAALILIVGPVLTPHRRHALAVAISALALLSLFFVGGGYTTETQSVRVSTEWLDQPALALRVSSFESYLWILILSLLAISLAEQKAIGRLSSLDQAMLFALTAVACGVVLAGNLLTLAFALLLFDALAAIFALSAGHPRRAVGRLLLGVLSCAAVMALAQGTDYLTAHPHDLGAIFALTVWLRVGLYPLAESGASDDWPPPVRLGWAVVNLTVGLYLIPAGAAPWLVWLAGTTTLLHGMLAWLEPSQERAFMHLGYGLAGGILTMAAVVGAGPGVVAASMGTLAALVALELTPSRPGRTEWNHPQYLWSSLPPLLATVTLVGVPLTLGWAGRGALYQATWEADALGVLALVVVAEGAALSVLYRYWEGKLNRSDSSSVGEEVCATSAPETDGDSGHEDGHWPLLGATLACIPFLIPGLGPRLVTGIPTTIVAGSSMLIALLGLVGSLLWALFLGHGHHRLLDLLPVSRRGLASASHLGWLLRSLGCGLDTLGRVILRVRTIIEGEHYLAWAILLALCLGLAILLR
jgi:hypothetical protein